MILPIGGGGLCGGFAAVIKQIWKNIKVYGVEPKGANVMSQSFQQGRPVTLKNINTIADSLAPPKAESYSYAICRQFVDDIVCVTDDQLKHAMRELFYGMKIVVEPAAAASTAGLLGPLKKRVLGKKVGLIACGTNIEFAQEKTMPYSNGIIRFHDPGTCVHIHRDHAVFEAPNFSISNLT